MSDEPVDSEDPGARLSLEHEREIDRLCLAYEERARTGELPDVETFLPPDSRLLWPRLREELSLLRDELAARTERGGPSGAPTGLGPGAHIGGYEIVGRLGAGGMGAVYEAVHARTRRHVALKVMRDGLHPRAARRFEREAQLLGSLHHPGIAQLYDAGVHEAEGGAASVPYLVMELLSGHTLIEHADEAQLDQRERLELFRRVCAGVQHAHDHGVVHRDLKPDNVVVVDAWDHEDRIGLPKVLDFGVASAIDRDRLATIETRASQLVGTISHMSPEQLEGGGAVDARADVYALGVVLFELLSGRLPHDVRGDSLAAAIDRIRVEEPPHLGELSQRLRGDIEVIVGKALEKRPADRYPSVGDLADDVDRHLRDLPVQARPPSVLVRAAKFTRRHRALVTGTAVALGTLLAALALVGRYALLQVELREQADDRRRVAEAVSDFLDGMLGRADLGEIGNTRDTTIYDALVAAEAEIDAAFDHDPPSRAAVRRAIGRGFLSQGEAQRAARQFELAAATLRSEASGEGADLARCLNDLAQAREELGELEAAEAGFREALALHTSQHEGDHPDVAVVLGNLGNVLERRGEYDEARATLERACAMWERLEGARSVSRSNALNLLAAAHESTGRLDAAEDAYRESLSIREQLLAPGHPRVATALNNLAVLLINSGRRDEAEPLLRRVIDARESTLDPDHPRVVGARAALAAIAYGRGDHADAAELYRSVHASSSRRRGPEHPETLQIGINLATVLGRTGDHEEAHGLLVAALEPYTTLHGPRSQSTLWLRRSIARNQIDRGQLDLASASLEAIVNDYVAALPDHYGRGLALRMQAEVATARSDTARAVDLLNEARRLTVDAVGENHPYTYAVRRHLAEALADHGDGPAARALTIETLRLLEDAGPDHDAVRARLEQLLQSFSGSATPSGIR